MIEKRDLSILLKKVNKFIPVSASTINVDISS